MKAKEVLFENQRLKIDQDDDSLFYKTPRFVHHLDASFRSRLTNLYASELTENSVILDLMSSWVSHLPKNIKFKKVFGHGLNKDELLQNKSLDESWTQNLNSDFELPLKVESIDTCLMVAAWQYLQYPEYIANELYRITKKGGKIIVSFSNRAFWNKTPNIWSQSSDEQRIKYVSAILNSQGWQNIKTFNEKTNSSFMGLFETPGDPFFSVIAYK